MTTLQTKGEFRGFAVNSFLIESIRPDKTIDHWVHYMTKTQGYITSKGPLSANLAGLVSEAAGFAKRHRV